jgi:hypothetical protein
MSTAVCAPRGAGCVASAAACATSLNSSPLKSVRAMAGPPPRADAAEEEEDADNETPPPPPASPPPPPPALRCAPACTQRHSIAAMSSTHVSFRRVRESAKPPNTNILSPSTPVALCFQRAGGRSPSTAGTLNLTFSPRTSSTWSASEGPGGFRWLSPPNMYSVLPFPTPVNV